MKKSLRYFASLLVLGLLTTCRDAGLNPVPEPEWAPVVTAQFTDDPGKSFFNFQNLRK